MLVFFLFLILLALKTHLSKPPKLEITACDVGQGDAVLIQYGQSTILIDTGPNSAVLECLSQELIWADRQIDLLVITHQDKDHAGGLTDVLENYAVDQVWLNPEAEQELLKKNQLKKIQTNLLAGDLMVFPGLRLPLVWSKKTRLSQSASLISNPNQDSISLYLTNGSFGFLTAGDLEVEQELAVSGMRLLNLVSLLKISHHGAKTSTSDSFLQQVAPEGAFISVGAKNNYGHPALQTLDNLDKNGVYLWRTDQLGSLHWQWDEENKWLLFK